MVVFSLDCRESFEEAIRLRESILETKVSATQSATKSRSKSHFNLKVPMVIVGNKCDKDTKYVKDTTRITVLNNRSSVKYINCVTCTCEITFLLLFFFLVPCFFKDIYHLYNPSRAHSQKLSSVCHLKFMD